MNNLFFVISIIIFYFGFAAKNNHQKGQSKFERRYRECSSTTMCMNRPNDEDCVYKCASPECYDELIKNPDLLVEFGEVNNEFKKSFEKCFAYKERTKKKMPRENF